MPPENQFEPRSDTRLESRIDAHAFENIPATAENESVGATGLGAIFANYKMRCPRCQRLYSVNAGLVQAAYSPRALVQPLRFQCQSETCKSRFEVGPLSEADLMADVLPTHDVPHAPVRPRAAGETAPLEETPCPKCQGRNFLSATECRHCGVVFSKYVKVEKLERLEDFGGRRELAELWSAIMGDYENRENHERFIEECYREGLLNIASQRYARILSATPNEEIARAMRRRITGLASFKAETATGPGGGPSAKPGFRIPKMNDLILVLGGATMTIGFMIPGCRDLVGVGSAAIALGVGVRFFLGPKSY